MDGSSFRRREAGILELNIENSQLKEWSFTPTVTNMNLQVTFPTGKKSKKMTNAFYSSLLKVERYNDNYARFYSRQYKFEMISHSLSTIHYIYSSKGLKGLMRIVKVRTGDIKKMFSRVVRGRNNMRYDSDAVATTIKKEDLQ